MYTISLYKKYRSKAFLLLLLCCVTAVPVFAQTEIKQPSSLTNPFVTLMVIIIALLAIVIAIMARVVTGTGAIYYEKQKKEDEEKKKSVVPQVTAIIVLLLCSIQVFAQDKAEAVQATASNSINGISSTAYYILCSVVFVELLIIGVLLYMLRVFAGLQKARVAKAQDAKVATRWFNNIWNKANNFKPISEEASIDLDHNYDGIRELDNRLPPWWLYGFYLTIIFAAFYLYTHHVSHSAPNSIDEYQAAVVQADIAKQAYLKKAANNVDETTVKLLTDEASINAGKAVFQSTCFACHGKQGEGGVGPNLTDDFWLHGGSVQDVFKSIKYGWADKGMKSWKDDFSPVQIAQIASYVKSLHGTNPPNAKPAQGTLFTEGGGAAKDSTGSKDSVNVMKKI